MIRFHLKYLGTSGAVELILYKWCQLNCHLILLLPSAGNAPRLRHYCDYVYNNNNLVDLRNFRWYLCGMWYRVLRFSLQIIIPVKTSLVASVAGSIAVRKLINEEHMRQALLLGGFTPDTRQSSGQKKWCENRDTNKEMKFGARMKTISTLWKFLINKTLTERGERKHEQI